MMIRLSIAIILGLIITLVLPIGLGFWLNKRFGVAWRVIFYGALGFFIVQSLVALLFTGLTVLIQNEMLVLSDQALLMIQMGINVVVASLLGVLIRWAGVKFLKEKLENLESAFGIGLGYGGVESVLLIGLPLLSIFISMLRNINIDPQTTTLDPAVVAQLGELWQIPAYIPLAGSLEQIAALVLHITVTILILKVFQQGRAVWLLAAMGLDMLVNGIIILLGQAGLAYGWVILVVIHLMIGNILIMQKLNVFEYLREKNAEFSGN